MSILNLEEQESLLWNWYKNKVTIPHLTFLKILAASPIDCVMPLKAYIAQSVQPLLVFSATLYGSSSLYSSSVMLPCSLGSMYSK